MICVSRFLLQVVDKFGYLLQAAVLVTSVDSQSRELF